jgi:hypothetical protein
MLTRKWINFFVILAFVLTAMPTLSHAMMSPSAAASKDNTMHSRQVMQDCHTDTHTKKTTSQPQPSKSTKNKCCDNDCQCFTGMCNGISKVLGAAPFAMPFLPLTVYMSVMSDNTLLSSFQYHIKRPPRA